MREQVHFDLMQDREELFGAISEEFGEQSKRVIKGRKGK
jgi:hypothetical protein